MKLWQGLFVLPAVLSLAAFTNCDGGREAGPNAGGNGPAAETAAGFTQIAKPSVALASQTAWSEALWLDDMGPRPITNPDRFATLEKIGKRFESFGAAVSSQRFRMPEATQYWGGKELANLSARIGPDCRETILLGTHWDTRATADEDPDPDKHDLPVPGFNDGTSGTAMLLDLARRLGSRKDLPFGIEFVLFDGEEGVRNTDLYFTGSKRFAAALTPERVKCYRAAVIFDMVADREFKVFAEDLSYSRNPWLYQELYKHGDPAVFSPSPDRSIYDDHLPLLAKGIPSALVIDLDYGPWHTRSDTREHCSPASLQATADMAMKWLESRMAAAAGAAPAK